VGTRGIDIWIGHSMATGGVIGKIRDSSFDLFGVRYRQTMAQIGVGGPTLAYTGGVVGADLRIPRSARPALPDSTRPTSDFRALGLGLTPVGLELAGSAAARFRPFASGHTGFIYFFAPVPDRQGKSVNFTASVGIGLRVRVVDASMLTVGYRYHHTSNGFRGQINPGVDANLLYVGITLFPRLPGRPTRPPE
jgi:hypothetical protein